LVNWKCLSFPLLILYNGGRTGVKSEFMEENVENEFILSPGVKNNTAEVIAEVKHVSKRYKGCLGPQ
jgi:hypothetical protein